jgi:hypothetical protein
MTTVILTKDMLITDGQASLDLKASHKCADCSGTNVREVTASSKIHVPEKPCSYKGSKIIAMTAAGNKAQSRRVYAMIESGKCPVEIMTDAQKLMPLSFDKTVNVIVITEAGSYSINLSEHNTRVSKIEEFPFMTGTGSKFAKAVMTIFPKISLTQVMSTVLQLDPLSGGDVESIKYVNKTAKVVVTKNADLPMALVGLDLMD